jgi:acyl-CoA synthetase (NDP forming)
LGIWAIIKETTKTNMLLGFRETKQLLKKYKIPIVKGKVIKTKKEAFLFAKKFGYPLVLKILSSKILHKTDIDGVILDIQDKKALLEAFLKIEKLAKKKKAEILIQKQKRGIEIITGAKKDPVFGPIVMFGLGGIFVEVFQDVSFRLAPITKREAKEMIGEIKSYKLLKGYRKREKVNLEKMVEILVNLSKLINNEKGIKEVDLNPIIANQKEVLVVDPKLLINPQ